jgi:hypothetical protein
VAAGEGPGAHKRRVASQAHHAGKILHRHELVPLPDGRILPAQELFLEVGGQVIQIHLDVQDHVALRTGELLLRRRNLLLTFRTHERSNFPHDLLSFPPKDVYWDIPILF